MENACRCAFAACTIRLEKLLEKLYTVHKEAAAKKNPRRFRVKTRSGAMIEVRASEEKDERARTGGGRAGPTWGGRSAMIEMQVSEEKGSHGRGQSRPDLGWA